MRVGSTWLRVAALLLGAAFGGWPVKGEIYEWRDGEGAHYTNRLDSVPAEHRGAARAVLTESELPAPAGEERSRALPPAEPPRQAQVVYDSAHQIAVYAQGVRDGVALSERQAEFAGASGVVIDGPLAVANAGVYPETAPWWYVPAEPLVTTSFDRGRSRHLTLRMLLQDQFQFDRDGPYGHRQDLPPRRLHPPLRRGLARR